MTDTRSTPERSSPLIVRAYRFRLRDYAITQSVNGGDVVDVVKSTAAIRALRKTRLIPGAKVSMRVPVIVHSRRSRNGI